MKIMRQMETVTINMKNLLAVVAFAVVSAFAGQGDAKAFLESGKVALGANYWASHAATEMWRKWDAKAIEEDLRVLSSNGIKLLRVFPNWADFQPIHACFLSGDNFDKVYETRMFDSEESIPDTPCGFAGVDERMVERFEEFCDIAERFGMRLIVPLLTGQMTFRNYIPPALANRNPFSDPYALMWEGRYLECMVSRLKIATPSRREVQGPVQDPSSARRSMVRLDTGVQMIFRHWKTGLVFQCLELK